MTYRIATAGAVLFAWLINHLLGFTSNSYAFLVPLAVLATFQINELKKRRNLLFLSILAALTILVYALDIESNQYVLFLPVIILAIFRFTENRSKDR